MDFELNSEQQMLGDNVARLMKQRYDFEARKAYKATPAGFSEALWREYAGLGLLELRNKHIGPRRYRYAD